MADDPVQRRATIEGMEQRVSLITLGVADVGRARAFYEALGWVGESPDDDVVFFQAGGMVVALWSRAKLAADSTVPDGGGWGGVALAHNVRSPGGGRCRPGRGRGGRREDRATRRPPRPGAATPAPLSTSTGTRGRSPTTPGGRSGTTESAHPPPLGRSHLGLDAEGDPAHGLVHGHLDVRGFSGRCWPARLRGPGRWRRRPGWRPPRWCRAERPGSRRGAGARPRSPW